MKRKFLLSTLAIIFIFTLAFSSCTNLNRFFQVYNAVRDINRIVSYVVDEINETNENAENAANDFADEKISVNNTIDNDLYIDHEHSEH